MIYTDMVTINGREFIRTYSDTYMVTRAGVEYDEAIDPIDSGRQYTESTTPREGISADDALDIILGGEGA